MYRVNIGTTSRVSHLPRHLSLTLTHHYCTRTHRRIHRLSSHFAYLSALLLATPRRRHKRAGDVNSSECRPSSAYLYSQQDRLPRVGDRRPPLLFAAARCRVCATISHLAASCCADGAPARDQRKSAHRAIKTAQRSAPASRTPLAARSAAASAWWAWTWA